MFFFQLFTSHSYYLVNCSGENVKEALLSMKINITHKYYLLNCSNENVKGSFTEYVEKYDTRHSAWPKFVALLT